MPSKTETEFWRDCPKCGKRIWYLLACYRDRALSRNSSCTICANSLDVKLPIQNDLPQGIVGILHCIECKQEIVYTSQRVFKIVYQKSLKNTKIPTCRSCVAKTQRKNPSEKQRKQWKIRNRKAVE